MNTVKISVLYDNQKYNPELKTGWGFSALVQTGDKNILFDTGGDGQTLLSNMRKMGINPSKIDAVVLSHIHGDHTGGLSDFLIENPNMQVYVPSSFPANFEYEIKTVGADLVEIFGPEKIVKGFHSTGELGTSIKEQGMMFETPKGLVLMTGCAHPGIDKMVEKVRELSDQRIYLVMGGFHLREASESKIADIISIFKKLGVEKIAPSHCTGEKTIHLFEKDYGNNYIKSGVGKIVEIK